MFVALSHVQVLLSPHLTARNDRSLKSYQEFKDGPLNNFTDMDW